MTDDDGTHVRVVCGECWGRRGQVEGIAADPSYLDISVPPNTRKTLPVEVTRHAFAYVFAGFGTFRDASPCRRFRKGSGSCSFRKPLEEPVAWYGDRHEHEGGAAAGDRGVPERDVYQISHGHGSRRTAAVQ